MKRVIVLVGPKGAGKSTIGHLLETELGIPFLRVEPLFLRLRATLGLDHPDYEHEGFRAVLDTLSDALSRHDTLCFESTGASPLFPGLLAEIGGRATVLPIQVRAEPEQCLERIRTRDRSIHIPVSDDRVERINALATRVELPWAARIDNSAAFDPAAVLDTTRRLLGPISMTKTPEEK